LMVWRSHQLRAASVQSWLAVVGHLLACADRLQVDNGRSCAGATRRTAQPPSPWSREPCLPPYWPWATSVRPWSRRPAAHVRSAPLPNRVRSQRCLASSRVPLIVAPCYGPAPTRGATGIRARRPTGLILKQPLGLGCSRLLQPPRTPPFDPSYPSPNTSRHEGGARGLTRLETERKGTLAGAKCRGRTRPFTRRIRRGLRGLRIEPDRPGPLPLRAQAPLATHASGRLASASSALS